MTELERLYHTIDQLRADWREDFRDFKAEVQRDSSETQAAVKECREDIEEVKLAMARMEEEHTPQPTSKKKSGSVKEGAISISLAGLGGVILWVLQKLFGQ